MMIVIAINYKIGQLFRQIYGQCSIERKIIKKDHIHCAKAFKYMCIIFNDNFSFF